MKSLKIFGKIFFIPIAVITLFYVFMFYTKNEESGVKIGYDLVVRQNFYSNLIFRNNIKKALNQDEKGLIYLIEIPADGAYGYAMGYVITQIIYNVGESNFKSMLGRLNYEQEIRTLSYIGVGLEYGDNDYDGEMDKTRFEDEFPILYKYYNDLIKKS